MVSTDMGNVGIESFGGHEAVASFGVTILNPVQSATYVKRSPTRPPSRATVASSSTMTERVFLGRQSSVAGA